MTVCACGDHTENPSGVCNVCTMTPSEAQRELLEKQTDPLLVYMTTHDTRTRDAAYLKMLATHIRNNTLATWDIPNTLANTVEAIARRLETRPA